MSRRGEGLLAGRLRALAYEERGSNLVEAALTMTMLLTVILSVCGMAMLAYAKHFVTVAPRIGTRYAMVRGSSFAATACSSTVSYRCQASADNIKSYVATKVPPGLNANNLQTTVTWTGLGGAGLACLTLSGSNSPGCVVKVSVTYPFGFNLPFLPQGSFLLQGSSTATILQ